MLPFRQLPSKEVAMEVGKSEQGCMCLIDCIPPELLCHMASYLDFDSLVKFLNTCSSLRSLNTCKDSSVLTASIPQSHTLRLEAIEIRMNKIAITERDVVNRARRCQCKELSDLRIGQVPIFAAKGSIVHRAMMKQGNYCSKNEIRVSHEVETVTGDDSIDICHQLLALQPIEVCYDLASVHENLDPWDSELAEFMDLVWGKDELGVIFGSHHVLEQATYSMMEMKTTDSLTFRIEIYNGQEVLSVGLPLTLVLISSDPIDPKVEELLAEIGEMI